MEGNKTDQKTQLVISVRVMLKCVEYNVRVWSMP